MAAAQTPDEYIASLPEGRREAVRVVRGAVRDNLPDGFEEGMAYGMIAWYVPLERFPNTYNGQPLGLAALASHKNYISLYLNSVYGSRETETWFQERYARSGKKLNMGKSCLRFRGLEDVALDVVAETINRVDLETFVAQHEAARGSSRKSRAAASPPNT
jgi:hypothetical protein